MSATRNDGGPAFPGPYDYKQDGTPVWGGDRGMSPRDWFAGKALAGLLADPQNAATAEVNARCAYTFADAMLAARKEVQS